MELHNTGVSDVTNIRIFEDYFVPAQDKPLALSRVGAYTVIEDQKKDVILKKGHNIPFKIQFDHLLDQIKKFLKDKKGDQYRIARIKVKFDRHLDKKEFEIKQIYIIAAGADILIAEDQRNSQTFETLPIREIKRILGME